MKLPEPNESKTLWSDKDDGTHSRLRIECQSDKDGDRFYTLHSEICEVDQEWRAGPTTPEGVRKSLPSLMLGLRHVANMTVASFVLALVKGKTEFPDRKPSKIARSKGWSVTLIPQGDTSYGEPLFEFEFSRPLCAEEMIAFVGNLAKAVDHYDNKRNE